MVIHIIIFIEIKFANLFSRFNNFRARVRIFKLIPGEAEASANSAPGSTWMDVEVRAFLAVWGEENIQQQLDGAVRNKTVYQTIARKLRDLGYNRDWVQCRNKIKNLKKTIQSS